MTVRTRRALLVVDTGGGADVLNPRFARKLGDEACHFFVARLELFNGFYFLKASAVHLSRGKATVGSPKITNVCRSIATSWR